MTDVEKQRLAEIEARLNAATPGPWEWRNDALVNPALLLKWAGWNDKENPIPFVVSAQWCNDGTAELEVSTADGTLIKEAPVDIAWLIEQLKAK